MISKKWQSRAIAGTLTNAAWCWPVHHVLEELHSAVEYVVEN